MNPHYSFLRVPKHRYMNTGLNSAKICQNRAAGSSGTGTTLTDIGTGYPLPVGTGIGLSGTGTDCPLYRGTNTTPSVPVPPTGFCQCFENRTGPAGPIGRTVDRPQNRFGSIKKPFLH